MKNDFFPLLEQASELINKYDLDKTLIQQIFKEIAEFKVTVPLVGGFSTGKSSLINAFIGRELLSTNITPETAVPAEIMFGEDEDLLLEHTDGSWSRGTLSEFASKQLDVKQYSLVSIKINNDFFRQIPDIKLVDMPGFDSGIELHNKAIDNYLPRSLAYIITVSADEVAIRKSILDFLHELNLHKVQVYIVITKSQRVIPEQLEQAKEYIASTVREFLDLDKVKIAVTNAKGKKDTSAFGDILLDLQSRSDEIYNKLFARKLTAICSFIERYLLDRLRIIENDMTIDDIKLEREQKKNKIKDLSDKISGEQDRFASQLPQCIEQIKNKIRQDLRGSSSVLESMLLQGSDISEKVNIIVRNAIISGVQAELEPKLKRYIRSISDVIEDDNYDAKGIQLDPLSIENDKKLSEALSGAVISLTSAISTVACGMLAGTLGIAASLLGPLGAAIGAVAGALITSAINRSMCEKQKREKQQLAREKINEVIDKVVLEVGGKLENTIVAYVDELNEQIVNDIAQEKERLEKSLADAEKRLSLGLDKKEKETAELNADLKAVRGMQDGI